MRYFIVILVLLSSVHISSAAWTLVDPEQKKAENNLMRVQGCRKGISHPKYGPVCISPSSIKTPKYTIKQVQKELKKQGFYLGNIDGLYGKNTAMSIKAFQTKFKFKKTGLINKSLFDNLDLVNKRKTK